jgi:DNA-directed RNA polymerase subunit beta
VTARRSGAVEAVDASRIIIRCDDGGADVYNLVKFYRSNQATCVNQKPIVRAGQKVKKNQVIADGPATDRGELALGKNVLVAFMPGAATTLRTRCITNGLSKIPSFNTLKNS